MQRREGFIFLSSPGAVTPFHIDSEYNFLLQVRGSKTVSMWDPADRFVLPEEELERFYATFVHRNLPWRDVFQTTAFVLPLAPGEGLHFPVTVPHWVKNGPEVSVSFSITFRTADSERRELLYKANARLRKLGLSPHARRTVDPARPHQADRLRRGGQPETAVGSCGLQEHLIAHIRCPV